MGIYIYICYSNGIPRKGFSLMFSTGSSRVRVCTWQEEPIAGCSGKTREAPLKLGWDELGGLVCPRKQEIQPRLGNGEDDQILGYRKTEMGCHFSYPKILLIIFRFWDIRFMGEPPFSSFFSSFKGLSSLALRHFY